MICSANSWLLSAFCFVGAALSSGVCAQDQAQGDHAAKESFVLRFARVAYDAHASYTQGAYLDESGRWQYPKSAPITPYREKRRATLWVLVHRVGNDDDVLLRFDPQAVNEKYVDRDKAIDWTHDFNDISPDHVHASWSAADPRSHRGPDENTVIRFESWSHNDEVDGSAEGQSLSLDRVLEPRSAFQEVILDQFGNVNPHGDPITEYQVRRAWCVLTPLKEEDSVLRKALDWALGQAAEAVVDGSTESWLLGKAAEKLVEHALEHEHDAETWVVAMDDFTFRGRRENTIPRRVQYDDWEKGDRLATRFGPNMDPGDLWVSGNARFTVEYEDSSIESQAGTPLRIPIDVWVYTQFRCSLRPFVATPIGDPPNSSSGGSRTQSDGSRPSAEQNSREGRDRTAPVGVMLHLRYSLIGSKMRAGERLPMPAKTASSQKQHVNGVSETLERAFSDR